MTTTKEDILQLLWKTENPASIKDVSEKLGLKARSANMHLLRLVQSGLVSKTKDGYYTITDSGKEEIGFPKTDDKLAKKALGKTLPEKAFHFYGGIDQPTGISSNSLADFCEKIKTLDMKSVGFHAARGDFEAWISSLGDIELAKRLELIRKQGLAEENLRQRLYKALRSRCDELLKK